MGPDLRSLDMATTVDPKPHSPTNRSGANQRGSVKTRISALVSSLHSFDVSTIERRDDWKADAFASLFNATLADIFGQNSQEYEEYSIRSFDTLPPATGVDYPLAEVRQGYQKGINAAIRKLNLLLDTPDKKVGAAEEVPPPAQQAGAFTASSADGKISLVTRRAEVKNRRASSTMVDGPAPGNGKAVKTTPEVEVSVEIVIDGQPLEPQPKKGMAGARNPGIADILGNSGKERNQREDQVVEYLEAMQKAVERARPGEKKNAQDEPETVEIKADEDLAVDEYLEAMQRALENGGLGKEKYAQDEPETVEIKADEGSRPLEPEGLASYEFSYQEPGAGSLPDQPPSDEPGKEALVPGNEAIVLCAAELPEALVEDRQEATPWSTGAELTQDASAEHVEPSLALASLDPLRSAEVAMTAGEEDDSQVAPLSAHLDEARIGDRGTGLPEPSEQAVYGKTTESRAGEGGASGDRHMADAFRRSWSGLKAKISARVSSLPARHSVAATIRLGTQMEEGSLADKPLKDELGREALVPGNEAIVLCAAELQEALAEDRQEATPWSPGAELTLEMDEGSRPLEPEGFLSAEFSYQDPCAGSLPDQPPSDEPGKEALVPSNEAIVLCAAELPEALVEDNQEATPWSTGAELTQDASAEHVEPSLALTSLDPLRSAEVAMTAGEENDFQAAPSFAISDAPASELLQEESSTFEHDSFSPAATEHVTEPVWNEIPAHELLSVGQRAGEPETSNRAITFDAVEDELPAASLEQTGEPMSTSSMDLRDVEALADRFAREIAGPYEPKVSGLSEERLSGDAVRIAAGLDQSSKAASSGPAEDLAQAAPEPAIKVREIEQNPFAIKDSEKKQSRPKITGTDDLRAQIKAITERIDDLKGFDVTTVTDRFDPRGRELRDSVNNTIADVFGRNTPAYWHHTLPSFDTIPVVLGSPRPPSPEEVRSCYVRTIDKAVTKLTAIVESLKQRLEKLEPGAVSENDRAAASAPHHEKDVMAVAQQEELPPGAEPPARAKAPAKEEAVERPVERVVIRAPEIGQNPFAIRDSEKKQSRPKTMGPADLQTQVGAIMERINDLRRFDATTITQRHDPRARELCNAVNSTLADVFGRNTPAYWRHSLPGFETGYAIVGSPNRSPAELRRSYEEGIDKAVTKLTAIAETLKGKLEQSELRSSAQ